MTGLLKEEDGLDYQTVLELVRQAVSSYTSWTTEAGLTHSDLERGDAGSSLRFHLPPLIAKGALQLPGIAEIEAIESFRTSEQKVQGNHIDVQNHLNGYLGRSVAPHLYGVANSAEIREMLPHRTGLVLEVNCTLDRHHGETFEDCGGMYGPSVALLDHLVIDPSFGGLAALSLRPGKPVSKIPFHWSSVDEWGQGDFPTGSLAVSLRPLYINPHPRAANFVDESRSPAPSVEHQFFRGDLEVAPEGLSLPYTNTRGEYTASRAFAIIHNPQHWTTDQFLNPEECSELRVAKDKGRLPFETDARDFREMQARYDELSNRLDGSNRARAEGIFSDFRPDLENGQLEHDQVLSGGFVEGVSGLQSSRRWAADKTEQGFEVIEGYAFSPDGKLLSAGRGSATSFRRVQTP